MASPFYIICYASSSSGLIASRTFWLASIVKRKRLSLIVSTAFDTDVAAIATFSLEVATSLEASVTLSTFDAIS